MKQLRKVYIVGNCYKAEIIDMLLTQKEGEGRYERAKSVDDSDIVLYTGGADVSPSLYGERPLSCTYSDSGRDDLDAAIYRQAVDKKKFVAGICRGAQITNVLNGGRLWQDVTHHALGESSYHEMYDEETGKSYWVSSLHHQECILNNKEARLVAFAKQAGQKRTANVTWMRRMNPSAKDVEAFWYPKTFTFGFQPHPEVNEHGSEGRNIFFTYLDRFYREREEVLKTAAGII